MRGGFDVAVVMAGNPYTESGELFKVPDMLAWLLHDLDAGPTLPALEVAGLATDSRALQPGDLFLAAQGLQAHGLRHVEQALARGAAAVVWEPVEDAELQRLAASLAVPAVAVPGLGHKLGIIADRFYAHPTVGMRIIGVTGTDGKTSVTHFIAQALSAAGRACGLLGTLGYGVYGALRTPTHTTPDALRLQAEFAALRDQGVRQAAMEVSSHALHQHRTAGVAFHTAVLTHLSRDHLDYHGSVEAYAEAKRRLFTTPGLACAVLNVADAFGRQLAQQLRDGLRVIAYQRGADGAAPSEGGWFADADLGGLRFVGARIAAADVPVLLVQEGGYLCPELGRNLTAFLEGFGGAA